MKSFFKKIALVLVLAMVVTMLPAKAVSAADTDGPQLSKQVKLYIGGDASESYSETAYAKVWNKDGYTVQFSSSDETVATVGKNKGLVTAVSVGEATITAVFTSADGETITKTCPVVVKKNAVAAGISENSAKTLADGIAVGESFQPKVYRTSADGETSWKGKDVITDGARFESSNTEIFTVAKTTGKVTAVAAGEATLYVWTVQGEKPTQVDENGKVLEYRATTDKVGYTVKVVEGTIAEVKQTKVDTFEITCTDEKVASEITIDNLSVAYVANGVDIQSFVKSVAVSDADKKVAIVTLHNGIAAGVTYKVTYKDIVLEFVGAELTPAYIAITTGAVEAAKDSEIGVAVYNAAGVDITAASDIANRVTISAPESTDYYVDSNARTIYFFNPDKSATVTATYDMLWDEKGNEIPDLTATASVTSYAIAISNGNISGWLVTTDASAATTESNFSNNPITLAAGDTGFFIYGVYTKTEGNNSSVKYTANGPSDNVVFTYASTNESILLVDPNTGELFPVAAGSAAVIVKAGDVVVGVCNISVVASRNFGAFTVSADKTKLSANADNADQVTVSLTVKDQLQADVPVSDFTVSVSQVATSDNKTIAVPTYDGDHKVIVTAGPDATATPRTVYIRIEVTAKGVTKAQTVPVSVKDVSGANVASYSVNVKNSIDLKLDADRIGKNDYDSTITVDYFDAAGYYLGTKSGSDLTEVASVNDALKGADQYSFVVTKNGQALDPTKGDADVTGTTLKTVTINATSGSSELVKSNTGSYMVRVYKGDGSRAQLIGNAVIAVSDSTVAMTTVQDSQNVGDIYGSLTFKRGNDTVNKDSLVFNNEMDATVTTSGTFVRTITVYEKIGDYLYKIVVPVYKLFK